MDRKFCVLLYSNHSKASLELLNYIKNIPIDFLTITGMTMICIDNPEFKLRLHNKGITHVPTLLVEYYSGSKQKFESEYIYMWIDQICNRNSEPSVQTNRTPIFHITKENNETNQPSQSSHRPSSGGPEPPVQTPQQDRPTISADKTTTPDATIPMNLNKKPDIAAIALEMQKNRELELAEIKEYQKPI